MLSTSRCMGPDRGQRRYPHRRRAASAAAPPASRRAGAGSRLLAPVRDLALLLRDVVASVLVQLKEGGHPGSRRRAALLPRSGPGCHPWDPCNNVSFASAQFTPTRTGVTPRQLYYFARSRVMVNTSTVISLGLLRFGLALYCGGRVCRNEKPPTGEVEGFVHG